MTQGLTLEIAFNGRAWHVCGSNKSSLAHSLNHPNLLLPRPEDYQGKIFQADCIGSCCRSHVAMENECPNYPIFLFPLLFACRWWMAAGSGPFSCHQCDLHEQCLSQESRGSLTLCPSGWWKCWLDLGTWMFNVVFPAALKAAHKWLRPGM